MGAIAESDRIGINTMRVCTAAVEPTIMGHEGDTELVQVRFECRKCGIPDSIFDKSDTVIEVDKLIKSELSSRLRAKCVAMKGLSPLEQVPSELLPPLKYL